MFLFKSSTLNVLQEGEISADLFTFHEAVSQLQLLEEEVLDSHTSLAQLGPQWMELDRVLLAMTNDVDYDQDGEISNSCSHHSSQNKQLDDCENVVQSVLEIQTCITFETIGTMFTLKTILQIGRPMDIKIIPQIRNPGISKNIPYISRNLSLKFICHISTVLHPNESTSVVLEVTAQLRTSGSTEKTCSKILTNI
jgi:hypothetical protein